MEQSDLNDYIGTCQTDDVASKIVEWVNKWSEFMDDSGIRSQLFAHWSLYHNGPSDIDPNGTLYDSFKLDGENDEIVRIRMNVVRNFLTQMLNLLFNRPPAPRCVAKTADPDAMETVEGAQQLLENDVNDSQSGMFMRRGGEWSLLTGVSFIHPEWSAFSGHTWADPNDQSALEMFQPNGAPIVRERNRLEVVYDQSKKHWADVQDAVVIDRVNKYALAANFPEHADAILKASKFFEEEFSFNVWDDSTTNDIALLKYYHRPVSSRFLPEGRYVLCLSDGKTVLYDGPNPYATLMDGGALNLIPINASQGLGQVAGHATMTDLRPAQDFINLMLSILATIASANGAGNVVAPAGGPGGSMVGVQPMVGGGRMFTVPPNTGDVKSLDLIPANSEFFFKALEGVNSMAQTISGMGAMINTPDMNNMSGVAIAQVKSMAIQFMSSAAASVVDGYQALWNMLIKMRALYSTMAQTVEIVGEDNVVSKTVELTQDKLKNHIAKVRADAVDPTSQTEEGKAAQAQELLQQGAFSAPWEYLTAKKTGRYEPLYKREMSHNMLIQRENAMMRKGEVPVALKDDRHDAHIEEHLAELDDPQVRLNPARQKPIYEHLAAHHLFKVGMVPLQGMDPQTGQPYPDAMTQWEQIEAQQQQSQSMTPPPQGPQGGPSMTQPPHPQGPPPGQETPGLPGTQPPVPQPQQGAMQ